MPLLTDKIIQAADNQPNHESLLTLQPEGSVFDNMATSTDTPQVAYPLVRHIINASGRSLKSLRGCIWPSLHTDGDVRLTHSNRS